MTWPAFVYKELDNCIRCGFCLSVCPTYKQTGLETASPRGRISLLRAVVEGSLDTMVLEDQFSLCLGCRACEVACPAGVSYGRLFEQGRAAVRRVGGQAGVHSAAAPAANSVGAGLPAPAAASARPVYIEPAALDSETTRRRWNHLAARRQGAGHWLESFAIKRLFPSPGLLRLTGHLLWFYQASGLARMLRRLRFFGLLPDHLVEMEAVLPRVPAPWARRSARDAVRATDREVGRDAGAPSPLAALHAVGSRPVNGPRVAVFTGCVQEMVFSETNYHTAQLVAAAGGRLVEAPAQACCGALHAHSGDLEGARALARRNVAAFEAAGVDVVVTNAGGCGAQLIEYPHLLEDEPEWAERARAFAARVQDISAFLVEQGYDPAAGARSVPQAVPAALGNASAGPAASAAIRRVTYQDSCHLANGQKVRNQPRQLLRALPDIDYREQVAADQCCGSAGIYNIVEPEMSGRILTDKMRHVTDTTAVVVATANPGCLLQIRLGIKRAGLEGRVRAVHIADLLAAGLPNAPER